MTPESPRSFDPFGFTDREKLYDRISHNRFLKILEEEQSIIHDMVLSTNSFGEFLFVTVSRQEKPVTFWGMGYHGFRERWLTQEWRWYDTSLSVTDREKSIPKDEAVKVISERQQQIEPEVGIDTQSSRGKFFEFLAELTDEDGALAELEDMGDVPDWFADEDE